jgi:hypothetical protein
MGSFAILRVSKVKSWDKLRQLDAHNCRRRSTPNADPARPTAVLVGGGNVVADVEKRLSAAGLDSQPLRKNGVLAVEILCTASPEFFRPGRADRAGEWESDRLESWKESTLAHLRQQWGGNLVAAGLHLDESTPHIWAVVVPVDENERKRGARVRLNAARWFDGAVKLAALQDAYAAAVGSLGLDRGLRGSKAKHEDIQRLYTTLHGEAAAARDAATLAVLKLGEADLIHRRTEEDGRRKREAATQAMASAFEDRKRAAAFGVGIEAFADGRLIEATGSTEVPTFRVVPMMPAERDALRRDLAPAWSEIWQFVTRIAARLEIGRVAIMARTRQQMRPPQQRSHGD